jgi:hypothetical protein
MGDLTEPIDGLIDITPPIQPQAREMVQAAVNSLWRLSDVANLQLVQEACVDSHANWSNTASLHRHSQQGF